MNVRSKDAEPEDTVREEKKKYLPIGYGGPNSGGRKVRAGIRPVRRHFRETGDKEEVPQAL